MAIKMSIENRVTIPKLSECFNVTDLTHPSKVTIPDKPFD